nr:hypothetical protein BaRGS_025492 [Batillaria attramentaria]
MLASTADARLMTLTGVVLPAAHGGMAMDLKPIVFLPRPRLLRLRGEMKITSYAHVLALKPYSIITSLDLAFCRTVR